ncbi:MAG: hypothetical protein A2Y25_01955 [Candidatus Melainabacteria bacterium GWF2_37_15]|nr:MAG: hypothetical protein A2Y25_01955 [Candidatus Melainabacteria bacterium GWF2_37_15]
MRIRSYYIPKKGFSIGEMLAVILIISILAVATAPMISKQQLGKNLEINTVKCVKSELAADLNTTACQNAIKFAKYQKLNAHKTLFFFADRGSTAEQEAARKVIRQACDEGGEDTCNYLVESCKKDSDKCDIAGSDYDLHYYLIMAKNVGDIGRMKIRDLTKPWYGLTNPNIVTAVDNACCFNNEVNTACDINDTTECVGSWIKHWGGTGQDMGVGIEVVGNYIFVVGYEFSSNTHREMFLLKLNKADGTTVWKKRYGDDAYFANFGEAGFAIDASPDGQYLYVTGTSNEPVANPNLDSFVTFVLKLNVSDGSKSWAKIFDNQTEWDTRGHNIAVSPDGNYVYVSGLYANAADAKGDGILMRLASDGSYDWGVYYGGNGDEMLYGITPSSDGNFIYTTGLYYDDAIIVQKLNAGNGTVEWEKALYFSHISSGIGIALQGNYVYVTGYSNSDSNGNNDDIIVIKLNATDGSLTGGWKKHYGGANDDYGLSIQVPGDGYVYVAGLETSDSEGDNDLIIMKINDSDGTTASAIHYGGIGEDGIESYKGPYPTYLWFTSDAMEISENNIFIAGATESASEGNFDILAMSINKNMTSGNMSASWTTTGANTNLALLDIGAYCTRNPLVINTGTWENFGGDLTPIWERWADPITAWTADGENVLMTEFTAGLESDGVPLD